MRLDIKTKNRTYPIIAKQVSGVKTNYLDFVGGVFISFISNETLAG